MLEYQKMIIDKVSFCKELFEKELRKSVARLSAEEVESLRYWAYQRYGNSHYEILQACFQEDAVMLA
ncbi:MAG: hypothetical protein JJT94_15245 [Bernardetiaceae bacterium]|nr:hypothetical protein [Bernardetiaceae bacterium]